LKIGVFAGTGSVWPIFQVQGVVPTNHFSYRKTGMIVLSCMCKNFVLSQFTHLTERQTDRQTDGRTASSWLIPPSLVRSAVNNVHAAEVRRSTTDVRSGSFQSSSKPHSWLGRGSVSDPSARISSRTSSPTSIVCERHRSSKPDSVSDANAFQTALEQ